MLSSRFYYFIFFAWFLMNNRYCDYFSRFNCLIFDYIKTTAKQRNAKYCGRQLVKVSIFYLIFSALGREIQKNFCISRSSFFHSFYLIFFSNFSILYHLKYRTANEIKMTLSYESHFDAKRFRLL